MHLHTADLSNCADEPIHIPGAIQPHGGVLAFDMQMALCYWSANVADFVDCTLAPGLGLDAVLAEPRLRQMVYSCAQTGASGVPARAELTVDGAIIDCMSHCHADMIVLEFERRRGGAEDTGACVLQAYVAIERIKHLKSAEQMLQFGVEQIRALTGFDRVMAYRFRHDDSGDVIAETTAPGVTPYLGQRYPASDIPAQARRLYTLNTLRAIADVGYAPVPVLGVAGAPALDMSFCLLRSISPIHVEYLQNMGVGASMSLSLVMNGRLWGLIACHHHAAHLPAYPVRLACDVLAQVIAAQVMTIETHRNGLFATRAADLRSRLSVHMQRDDDVLGAIVSLGEELADTLGGQGLIASHYGKLVVHGPIDTALAAAIVASLPQQGKLLERVCRTEWPAELQGRLGPWVGALALNFDAAAGGWLVALRTEQMEQIRWGGKPEKTVRHGPLGARLTPRGSFDEWVETVRDRAEPWNDQIRVVGDQLLAEMRRVCMRRHADVEQARMQLLAMLGHDLRTPLQSIAMAASVLKMGNPDDVLGGRIERSSGRMQRLISQVMDLSRLENGLQIEPRLGPVPLRALLEYLIDEAASSHPGTAYRLEAPVDVVVDADQDQLAQVLSNLLSNARHYGIAPAPIVLQLAVADGEVLIKVRNVSPPIPAQIEKALFVPFKPRPSGLDGNRGGLGIGLYISHAITRAHGGSLRYRHVDEHVEFTVALPAQRVQ
jgi:chemotaxis family two-component system sensor kinase Cph1